MTDTITIKRETVQQALEDAISQELAHVSQLPYNSHEICKHFAGRVAERFRAALQQAEPQAQAGEPSAAQMKQLLDGLGTFKSLEQAASAVQKFRSEHHGEFARH